ncbi:response regulator [Paenibacillus macerans]|uniref:Response regulator n=1 Tax=Paenibacillus macerans TaxID=44252 RepID=A0A090YT83_PAEMA|nr:response regulator [Paenibacillus macerans]
MAERSASSRAAFRSAASIAPRICSRSSRPTCAMSCELVEADGLRIKSKAPSSRAMMVSLIPCSLIPDSIMTGSGCSFIITLSASSPFISGISTSMVTRSGFSPAICSIASRPFLAVASTLKSGSCSTRSDTIFRINAESSTTNTR